MMLSFGTARMVINASFALAETVFSIFETLGKSVVFSWVTL
jgi:hypothetical protein